MAPNRRNGECAKRDEQGRKHCTTCDQWVDPDEFCKHPGTRDGIQVRCRSCVNDIRVFTQYGITRSELTAKLAAQGFLCAICVCDIRGRYVVDHDHSCCPGPKSCGKCVRALLCDGCNLGLGSFKDSTGALFRAIQYLRGRYE